MELPKHILTQFIEKTESYFIDYNRKSWLDEETLIGEASDLYKDKKIIILDSKSNINNIIGNSSKPWVYHYTLNLNWILFFKSLYESMWTLDLIDDPDLQDVYVKVYRLEVIFNHVDGIVEDGDKVYLIKDDINLIQKDIRKLTLS
jgi:hypothetical protein